jgi:hypothetical protein
MQEYLRLDARKLEVSCRNAGGQLDYIVKGQLQDILRLVAVKLVGSCING